LRVLTGSPQDAEDIVHDVFLGLPESLRSYEHRGQLHGWLSVVATRIALMRMRTVRRREQRSGSESEAQLIAARDRDLWTAADLESAIAALPESLRVVFVMRQIEDRSHDETAELLGLSSGAVRVRYVRAIARLRKMLEADR